MDRPCIPRALAAAGLDSIATFDGVPPLPTHPDDSAWETTTGRIWFQVDCKGVADVLNGDAVLDARHLECIFKRMTRRLLALSQQGWDTRHLADPYIIWSPRAHNTPPDHLCNAAMDNKMDFVWHDKNKVAEAMERKFCIKVCVDGGMRGPPGHPTQSAMGVTIYRRVIQQSGPTHSYAYDPMYYSAQQLYNVSSAFQSESMALECALDTLSSFLRAC